MVMVMVQDEDEDVDWKTPDAETCATLCDTKFIQFYLFKSGTMGYCSCFPECDLTRPATSYKENAAKVYEVVGEDDGTDEEEEEETEEEEEDDEEEEETKKTSARKTMHRKIVP